MCKLDSNVSFAKPKHRQFHLKVCIRTKYSFPEIVTFSVDNNTLSISYHQPRKESLSSALIRANSWLILHRARRFFFFFVQ